MRKNQKKCSRCDEYHYIWKCVGRDKYCKRCWFVLHPPVILKPVTRIPKKGAKRLVEERQYRKLRAEFLVENPCCKGKLEGCTRCAPEFLTIQHLRGRVGRLYLDTRYWITLCMNCHEYVNTHPKEALELGLAESRLKNDDT